MAKFIIEIHKSTRVEYPTYEEETVYFFLVKIEPSDILWLYSSAPSTSEESITKTASRYEEQIKSTSADVEIKRNY
jgi:hypothetical protein